MRSCVDDELVRGEVLRQWPHIWHDPPLFARCDVRMGTSSACVDVSLVAVLHARCREVGSRGCCSFPHDALVSERVAVPGGDGRWPFA